MEKKCYHNKTEIYYGYPKNQRKGFKNNALPNKARMFCSACGKLLSKWKIKR